MSEPIAKPPVPTNWILFLIISTVLLVVYLSRIAPEGATVIEVPYSQFKALVNENQVVEIKWRGNQIRGSLHQPTSLIPGSPAITRFRTLLPPGGDQDLLEQLQQKKVEIIVLPEQKTSLSQVFASLIPWLVIIGVWVWLMRRTYRNLSGGIGGRGDLNKFLQPAEPDAKVPDVRFDDVAGQENAKNEVVELVEFLRDPQRFLRLGAEVPRGVLLMGPPGTGKTLLARALAGEAGVPFFSISGSEFIEVFVGVGASRVRKLFEAAKAKSPSIIFIDELDSVGRTRGTGLGGGHDEREQTLNQILAQMDGFSGHEAIIVLAATNRPDVLDPALLRPGRFDRHVVLGLPEKDDREKILKVHVRNVPLADDVDLSILAAGTPGFSGADLKNIINEAAFMAARKNEHHVTMADFDEARDKLLLGTARTMAIQPEEKHRLAVHEAGHTALAFYLPNSDPLYKVTIIPHGRALGGTQQLPEEERHTLPEDYLRDRLSVTLAGRVAEKIFLGSVSSGADDDINKATNLARAMVSRWGMSDEVGPVDLRESESHPFLGKEIAQPRRFSESSAHAVDKAVRELLQQAEETASQTIELNKDKISKLIETLEAEETLHREQIESILKVD
jgi:cell division protease FtsH